MIVVTGGAGFIGSHFIHAWLSACTEPILNIDKLSYAGNLDNLQSIAHHPQYQFVQADILDRQTLSTLLTQHQPRAVIHFAAESHVDRSIHGADDFIQTNIVGTFCLLEELRAYHQQLTACAQAQFRLLHVSTDEVYGSLTPQAAPFAETDAYQPNSPYAASKAASDHLVRAWYQTYGLPVITTHCSNNYGAYQFPEKLIPLMILNAISGKDLPIYGDGQQIRDWIYVQDHCAALRCILQQGTVGEVYNIGGEYEVPNLTVVQHICDVLDELKPRIDGQSYTTQIRFVTDRAGHDRRYAVNTHKLKQQLGFIPQTDFLTGLRQTILWYLEHPDWLARVQSGAYRTWIQTQYHQGNLT